MQAIRMDVDNGDESTITVPYPERSAKTIEEVFKGSQGFVVLTDQGVIAGGRARHICSIILAMGLDNPSFAQLLSEALEIAKDPHVFTQKVLNGDVR